MIVSYCYCDRHLASPNIVVQTHVVTVIVATGRGPWPRRGHRRGAAAARESRPRLQVGRGGSQDIVAIFLSLSLEAIEFCVSSFVFLLINPRSFAFRFSIIIPFTVCFPAKFSSPEPYRHISLHAYSSRSVSCNNKSSSMENINSSWAEVVAGTETTIGATTTIVA